MKITIENGVATVLTVQPSAEVSSVAGAVPAPTSAAASNSGFSLSDLLARAASLGAINAGAAPSLAGAAIGPAPIAASIGATSPGASMITSSAGAPGPHAFGSTGCGK